MLRILISLVCCVCFAEVALAAGRDSGPKYLWCAGYDAGNSVERRIAAPAGCERIPVEQDSFARWLRGLPLKGEKAEVKLFDGRLKPNQSVHHAVIDIDTGARDLQQCADCVMRLRAEYLLAAGRSGEIHFNFTSGHRADYSKWVAGFRPVIRGNQVTWSKTAAVDSSYTSFRTFLNVVFTYAGTVSLSKELAAVKENGPIRAGDVFIQAGTPGHAVIIVDVARDAKSGKEFFLLAQGYMPAQDMHILKNPNDAGLSPWYPSDVAGELKTPEWTFRRGDRKRF